MKIKQTLTSQPHCDSSINRQAAAIGETTKQTDSAEDSENMAKDDDASKYRVVTHRKSKRLNPGYEATMKTGESDPPIVTQSVESQTMETEEFDPPIIPALAVKVPSPRRYPRFNAPKMDNTSAKATSPKIFFGPNPSWLKGKPGLKKIISPKKSHAGAALLSNCVFLLSLCYEMIWLD